MFVVAEGLRFGDLDLLEVGKIWIEQDVGVPFHDCRGGFEGD